MFVLWQATLLRWFINSSSFFLVKCAGFSVCNSMSSVNLGNLASSFPILMSFLYFSFTIDLAEICKTIYKSGGSWHPFLIPGFSPVSIILTVSLSCVAFLILRFVPSIPNLWRPQHKGLFSTTKCLLCIYGTDHVGFVLHSAKMIYDVY